MGEERCFYYPSNLTVPYDTIANKRASSFSPLELIKAYDSVTFHILEKTLLFYEFPKKTVDLVRKLYKDNVGDLQSKE